MTIARPAPATSARSCGLVHDREQLPAERCCYSPTTAHVDPNAGIARYGPRSLTSAGGHPTGLPVGFIRKAERIDVARTWLANQAEGVNGDAKNPDQ